MKQGATKAAIAPILVALSLVTGIFASSGSLTSGLSSLTNTLAGSINKAVSPEAKAKITQRATKLPLYFIQNQGQVDAKVSHYLKAAGTSVYFTNEGLTYSLRDKTKADSLYNLKVNFVGANQVVPTPMDKTEATMNFFQGSKDQWKTGVPTSSAIKYTNLWPGIDLVYKGTGQKLEYDFHVAPGADPSQIKLEYQGATELKVNAKGQLQVKTPAKTLTDERPRTFLETNGLRTKVTSAYQLTEGSSTYGFKVGNYDRTKPLVIDPVSFVYSGFVGGAEIDQGEAIAVDATGAAYVTGIVDLPNGFPAGVGPSTVHGGGLNDVFVAKINPAGTGLLYAGFIGGSGDDRAFGIAIDAAGAAYIAGTTDSTESSPVPFPLITGPDLTFNGVRDAYVAKVNPSGSGLVYSGYIGGAGSEGNQAGIAVTPAGNAYVTGLAPALSDQFSFPVAWGPDLTPNGGDDVFVAKVSLSGGYLNYAGYIGGSANDSGQAIAVDATGIAYVTGVAASAQATFPDAVGPDLTHNGGNDAFLAKVLPDGTGLVSAGYIGGSLVDIGNSIAIDATGAAFIGGQTTSNQTTFPSGPPGFGTLPGVDQIQNGATDGFVVKVNSGATGLVYAGFIGGSGIDIIRGVAIDGQGAAYVSGETVSTETTFPVLVGPDLLQEAGRTGDTGLNDGFIARVLPAGTALSYSGFLGGDGNDVGRRVATDGAGNAYVTGIANSNEATFPVVNGPDTSYNGSANDAFVSKISYTAPLERIADFDGNGATDIALYRNGTWYPQAGPAVGWGGDPTDKAVPADYNGDGTTDIAIYRVSTGTWWVKDQFTTQWGGNPADIPVPADYNGDGKADLAVYRNGIWYVKDQFTVNWGGLPSADVPVPGDYDNNGVAEVAVYRKATGVWYLQGFSTTNAALGAVAWGGAGTDIPVPGDYTGDGATDLAVYRKATGDWFIKNLYAVPTTQTSWGGDGTDVPAPGDYDNNGTTDLAVYRVGAGYWYIKDQPGVSWGGDPADKALPLPSAIRD